MQAKITPTELLPAHMRPGAVVPLSVTVERFYWVGVTPDCPKEWLTCAGICFPKVEDELIRDPGRTGDTKRRAVIGSIVKMDAARIELIRDRLPRMILRPLGVNVPEVQVPASELRTISDNGKTPRNCRVIIIPKDEDVRTAAKQGRATQAYIPQANDEPAAKYMFAVLCDDQERGNRSDFYPDTLDITGLDWSDDTPAKPAPKKRGRPSNAERAAAAAAAAAEANQELTQ